MKKLLGVVMLGGMLGVTPLAFAGDASKKDALSKNPVKECHICDMKGKGRNPFDDKMDLLKKLKQGPFLNTVVLENLMESGVPLVILDARSGEWDDATRIPGAQSLNDQSTEDQVQKVIKSKDTLVVTYCGNLECGASHKLYVHLKKLGYKNVVEYPFGIQGWLEAGNDVSMAK